MSATVVSKAELATIAREIRRDIIRVSHANKIPHLGSSLSCVEVLTTLYFGVMKVDPKQPRLPERDYFLLSKGHAASALYTTLAHRGFFPRQRLFEHGETNSAFEEHPGAHPPDGVESVGGSLGHGLSLACGMALGSRLRGMNNRFYVLMGDGELNEGTVWEAAMFAATHRLGKVTVIIDCNKWQGTGRSDEIMCSEPLDERWRAFGWHCIRVSGNDSSALIAAFAEANTVTERPIAIIADTKKGAGVSFMEDDNNWHYRIPSDDEFTRAMEALSNP